MCPGGISTGYAQPHLQGEAETVVPVFIAMTMCALMALVQGVLNLIIQGEAKTGDNSVVPVFIAMVMCVLVALVQGG